jgi:hypothetical protein
MSNPLGKSVLLDDGEFVVVSAAGDGLRRCAGFLERRCGLSAETPNGLECLGAFVQRTDGAWEARISTPIDAASGTDCKVVAASNDRLDAVVALWQARHQARRQTTAS